MNSSGPHRGVPGPPTKPRPIQAGPNQAGSPASADSRRLMMDAALAAVLACTLFVVFLVDRGQPPDEGVVELPKPLEVQQTEHTEELPTVVTQPLRLAVTPARFDDMGSLLRKLGEGYGFDEIQLDELRNKSKLAEYDVIFLTCGTDPESWLGERVGVGERNATTYMMKESVVEELRESLRNFVQQGGTLYASDWRVNLVQLAFSEYVDDDADIPGAGNQHVDTEVVDGGLREVIGERIPLNFDMSGWRPAAFRGEQVKVYLRGGYRPVEGGEAVAPLLIKFQFGEGMVLFTSFHNEKQNSEIELELLKYLVFTTVTAKVERKVTETMVQGGFSPRKQNLLSTSSGDQTISKTYQCKAPSHLQFVLAFAEQGADMRLTIKGPDGKTQQKDGTSTLTVDVENAAPGEWTYSVTARKVPFENFPFTLTVWER